MRFILTSFFILMMSFNSGAAGLRCFNLFSKNEQGTIEYNAEFLDLLNTQADGALFQKKLSDSLETNLDDQNIFSQGVARYRAFKLRRLVKKLNEAGNWDRYDFENYSKKIERLSFLMDNSIAKNMSSRDQVLYRQAQHSLLAKGLENFFFDKQSKVNPSVRQKIFQSIMVPFKDIYMRWTYAWMLMPKLNGAVIPVDLAMKVLWEGVDAHRAELQPYILRAQTKNFFNTFSVVYNWSLVTAIFVGLPIYSHYVYQDIQVRGNEQIKVLFQPLVEQSQAAAQKDYVEVSKTLMRKNFYESFQAKYEREPTAYEKDLIEVAIAKRFSTK